MDNNRTPLLWRSERLRTMVTCAILVAMGTVLGFIKIFEAPYGGSVTLLSMLPIAMAGLLFGCKWGFGTAFVYSVIQLMTASVFAWGLSPTVLLVCILFDYIVAFTALGVTGLFKGQSRPMMLAGVFAAVALRMICHYISGVTIWESMMPEEWNNVWLYSLVYNGAYMLPEAVFTMVGAFVITSVPQIRRFIDR